MLPGAPQCQGFVDPDGVRDGFKFEIEELRRCCCFLLPLASDRRREKSKQLRVLCVDTTYRGTAHRVVALFERDTHTLRHKKYAAR